jgi:anti-sigma factor ChrR (cupin superfamily)
MTSSANEHECEQTELVALLALRALPPEEERAMEKHVASCPHCREELEVLRPVVESFDAWPTDVVRPAAPLWDRLSQRIAAETGVPPLVPVSRERLEPEWEEVAPGISCKLLATDTERGRVSMLVRLAPGAAYPPHVHAGLEELHLLEGELWIEDRKLYPGDCNRAEPGTRDTLVWSETGCTCVLITSYRDVLA